MVVQVIDGRCFVEPFSGYCIYVCSLEEWKRKDPSQQRLTVEAVLRERGLGKPN